MKFIFLLVLVIGTSCKVQTSREKTELKKNPIEHHVHKKANDSLLEHFDSIKINLDANEAKNAPIIFD